MSCGALNVAMGIIAWTLQDPSTSRRDVDATPRFLRWRVLMLAPSLFLYSYGYGAITTFSAVYADAIGIRPKSLYVTTLALALLAARGTFSWFIASAIVFGVGFAGAYPAFVGYVMRDIDERRRGAAFGTILAATDTGVGTGSTLSGWVIQQFGFRAAFGTAAALAAMSVSYFILVDRRLR